MQRSAPRPTAVEAHHGRLSERMVVAHRKTISSASLPGCHVGPIRNRADWRTIWFSYERLPSAPKVFRGVLPRRWVVERTFAWLCQNRRFSRDYERLCTTSEALIYAAMGRLMLRRLARN